MREELNIGKISCICITHDRTKMLKKSVFYYTQQVYTNKELLVFYDSSDLSSATLAREAGYTVVGMNATTPDTKKILTQGTSDIVFVEIKNFNTLTLGEKRNFATAYSEADYLCVWDDDDWYSPDRLWQQALVLENTGMPACTLNSLRMYDSLNNKGYTTTRRREGWEGSLLCKRIEMGQYAAKEKLEDTPLLLALSRARKICVLDAAHLYIYIIHKTNTWNQEHFNWLISLSTPMNDTGNEMIKNLCHPGKILT